MFSLDNVLSDLWPEARTTPWQKKVLQRVLYEKEFQLFAARHCHLKGVDMVEQVLEHLQIRCEIPEHHIENIPENGPLIIIANHRGAGWTGAHLCPLPRTARHQSGD